MKFQLGNFVKNPYETGELALIIGLPDNHRKSYEIFCLDGKKYFVDEKILERVF